MLRTLLEDTENVPVDTLLGIFYQGGKRKIASYAPLVFTAAKAGDHVAERIIDRNLTVVADLLTAAAAPFPKEAEIPVVVAGGMTQEETLPARLMEKITDTRLRIRLLDVEPVDGAILLARELNPTRERV